jgi:hypothetical protein
VLDLCSPTRAAVSARIAEPATARNPSQTNIMKIRVLEFIFYHPFGYQPEDFTPLAKSSL